MVTKSYWPRLFSGRACSGFWDAEICFAPATAKTYPSPEKGRADLAADPVPSFLVQGTSREFFVMNRCALLFGRLPQYINKSFFLYRQMIVPQGVLASGLSHAFA